MTVRYLNYVIILVACLPSFLLPSPLSLNDILLASFFVFHLFCQVGKLSLFFNAQTVHYFTNNGSSVGRNNLDRS